MVLFHILYVLPLSTLHLHVFICHNKAIRDITIHEDNIMSVTYCFDSAIWIVFNLIPPVHMKHIYLICYYETNFLLSILITLNRLSMGPLYKVCHNDNLQKITMHVLHHCKTAVLSRCFNMCSLQRCMCKAWYLFFQISVNRYLSLFTILYHLESMTHLILFLSRTWL